jgi:hypothetical protein
MLSAHSEDREITKRVDVLGVLDTECSKTCAPKPNAVGRKGQNDVGYTRHGWHTLEKMGSHSSALAWDNAHTQRHGSFDGGAESDGEG